MVGQRFQHGTYNHCGQGRHELLLIDKFQILGTMTLSSQASPSLVQAEQGSLVYVPRGLHLAVGIQAWLSDCGELDVHSWSL